MTLADFTIRILVALCLGIAIGIERQWRQRVAGLRTNALVALGSALFASLANLFTHESSPTRMAAQIVSGIGFLGAGLILRDRGQVHGLNTAATLWCAAAIGTLAGSGYLGEATVGTFFVIVAHMLLRPLARKLARQRTDSTELETLYKLKIVCTPEAEANARAKLLEVSSKADWSIKSLIRVEPSTTENLELLAEISVLGRQDKTMEQIAGQLGIEIGITSVSWEVLEIGLEVE